MNKVLFLFERYIVGIIMGILIAMWWFSRNPVEIEKTLTFTFRIPEIKKDSTLIDSIENLKRIRDYLKGLLKKDSAVIRNFYALKKWELNTVDLDFVFAYRGKMFPEWWKYTIKEREIKIDTVVKFEVQVRKQFDWRWVIPLLGLGWILNDLIKRR